MSAPGNLRRTAGRDDWETPPAVFDSINEAVGGFDYDAAASKDNAKAARYIDEEMDALDLGTYWGGPDEFGWLNPPFSLAAKFAQRAAAECNTNVVALLPQSADTSWFHKWVWGKAAHLYFVTSRIQFIHPPNCGCQACEDGRKGSNSTGSIIAVYQQGYWETKVHRWDYRREPFPYEMPWRLSVAREARGKHEETNVHQLCTCRPDLCAYHGGAHRPVGGRTPVNGC